MAYFITQVHAAIRNARLTRRHATARPEHVLQGLAKEYPRMRQIPLTPPEAPEMTLAQALSKRRSLTRISDDRPFSIQKLSTLLGTALSAHSDGHRPYPSGGRLYPIETYLIGNVLEHEPRGIFHYNPNKHALEFLWEDHFEMGTVFRRPQGPLPPCTMVFTAIWERGSAKYGDLNYYHSLIEAGHAGENILLTATAMGFASRPHSGFDDTTVSRLLELDDRVEQPIYTILLAPGGNSGKAPEVHHDG